MQFSLSFFLHFILSLAGFLALGIYLCRGTWRNTLRSPLQLGLALILLSHVWGSTGPYSTMGKLVLVLLFAIMFVRNYRSTGFVPSEVRGGHNGLSLMIGAALFGLTVQLHYAVTGISVFELVK